MPRTEKSTMKAKSAWPNGLRFVASLFFLYVIFGSTGSGWWSQWVTAGAGSLWLPILFGVAVLSSIALFFGSLAGLAWKMSSPMGWKTVLFAAFSLTALTVSTSFTGVFWIVIVGFLIAWVASALEMM